MSWSECLAILIATISLSKSQLRQPCYYCDHNLSIAIHNHQIAYFAQQNAVYLFGGESTTISPQYLHTVYKWNVSNSNNWFQLMSSITSTQFWSSGNNVVVINESAYFIGVYDGAFDHGNIYVFDSNSEQFIDSSHLSHPDYAGCFGCQATNNSHIFMVGGLGDPNFIHYLQIYNIVENQWYSENITISPINTGWAWQYCHMMQNKLFVFGGAIHPSQTKHTKNYYKWEWQSGWTYLGQMSDSEYGGAVAVYQDKLFLVGGSDGVAKSSDIRIFDMNKEIMLNHYSMIKAVAYLSSLVIAEELYIFGGLKSVNGLSSGSSFNRVQICDIISLAPTETPTPAPTPAPTLFPTPAPTEFPTLLPSMTPSIIPTPSPTPSPSPTSVPTVHPTLFPTYHDGNLTTTFNSTIKVSISSGFNSSFISYIIISILILIILFAILLGIAHAKKHGYKFNWQNVAWFGYHLLDFLTDVIFMLLLYNDSLIYLFVISLALMFLSSIVSTFQLHKNIKIWLTDDINDNNHNTIWFAHYASFLYFICFIVGSVQSAVHLCSSNAFQLERFNLKFSEYYQMKLHNQHLLSNVLFENIPQLILEILYISEIGNLNDITLLAMIFSVSSIVMAPFIYMTRKQILLRHQQENIDVNYLPL